MSRQFEPGNASTGRVYNAYNGGGRNFEADRALAGQVVGVAADAAGRAADLAGFALAGRDAVRHFVEDHEAGGQGPGGIAGAVISRLAPGSLVAISHACSTGADPDVISGISAAYERHGLRLIWRDEQVIKDLFTGRVAVQPPPGAAGGGLGDPRSWLPSPEQLRQGPAARSPVSLRAGIGIVTQ